MDKEISWVYERLYGKDRAFWSTYQHASALSLEAPRREFGDQILTTTNRTISKSLAIDVFEHFFGGEIARIGDELCTQVRIIESLEFQKSTMQLVHNRIYQLFSGAASALFSKSAYMAASSSGLASLPAETNLDTFLNQLVHQDEGNLLLRLMGVILDNTKNFVSEFVCRISNDISEICAMLELEATPRLITFKSSGADYHNKGRTALLVSFDGKESVLYKPTSGGPQAAWSTVVEWATSRDSSVSIMVPRSVDHDSYHWVEFVRWEPARGETEIKRFYESAGNAAALAYFVGLGDLHFENIIACKDAIAVVDTEAIFAGERNPLGDTGNGQFNVFDTALQSGLFPMGGLEKHPLDVAGLSTDAIALNGATENMLRHLPSTDPFHKALFYQEDIQRGFKNVYLLVSMHANEFAALISTMRGVRARIITRPTTSYFEILKASMQPVYLNNEWRWSASMCAKLLEAPAQRADIVKAAPIAKQELVSLMRLDIPYFWTYAGKLSINSEGPIVDDFLTKSGLDASLDRVTRTSPLELDYHLACIRTSLASSNGHGYNFDVLGHLDKNNYFEEDSQGLAYTQAQKIGEELWNKKIPTALGGTEWLSWIPMLHRQIQQLGPVGYGLYHGTAGIGLFYGALAQRTKSQGDLDRLNSTLFDIMQMLESEDRQRRLIDTIGLSLASGVTGVIYALTAIVKMGLCSDLILPLQNLIRVVTEDLLREVPRQNDVIEGKAGILLGLRPAQEMWPTSLDDRVSRRIIEDLFRNLQRDRWRRLGWMDKESGTVLAGMAHGTSGIVCSIMAAGQHLINKREEMLLEEALRAENRLFDESTDNWSDLRPGLAAKPKGMHAWCTGSTGILLARMATLSNLKIGSNTLQDELSYGIEARSGNSIAWEEDSPDHLCCGNLGRMVLGQELCREGHIMTGANAVLGNWNVDKPGFFQGIAGIGYYLLRNDRAAKLPNVATFQ